MRITIRLFDELFRRAKKAMAEKGQTLTSLIEEGRIAVIAEPRPAPPVRLRLPVSKVSGGALPGLDLKRSSDLEDRMSGL